MQNSLQFNKLPSSAFCNLSFNYVECLCSGHACIDFVSYREKGSLQQLDKTNDVGKKADETHQLRDLKLLCKQ